MKAILAFAFLSPFPAAAQVMDIAPPAFVEMVASSNAFEIRASKLAERKASDPGVKAFAARMVADHKKAAEELRAAAGDIAISDEMAPKHAGMVALLDGAEGAEFDMLYKDMQAGAHAEAVTLFTTFAEGGKDPSLRAFALETLPTLEVHKTHIGELVAGH